MLTGNKKLRLNTNNPDFYALFLLLISNVSDYDNWRNVMVLIKNNLEKREYDLFNRTRIKNLEKPKNIIIAKRFQNE